MKKIPFTKHSRRFAALVAAVSLALLGTARADLLHYYVGVDGLQTLASGTYAGEANPNFNRLTFLYAHHFQNNPSNNHYHSKATQIYTGGMPNPTVITSPSDFTPEGTRPPLTLFAGSGLYAGKLASAVYSDPADTNYPFSQLTLGQTGSLASFASGTGEAFLFNASSGRWTGSLNGGDIHLELVSLTPGLNVGSANSLNIMSVPGDDFHLGDDFEFTPTFWTDENATPGVYEAAFKLTDEAGLFGESGAFRYRVEVVPEPGTIALLVGAGVMFLVFRRRLSGAVRG